MESTVCMNGLCGAPSSKEWRKGWALRSGGFANLCDKCGSAYEQLIFCDTFHLEDTGWRECTSCGKRLHCGCIASSSLLELLDCGGVKCSGCVRSSQHQPTSDNEKPRDISMSATTSNGEKPLTSIDNKVDCGDIDETDLRNSDGNERHNGLKDLLPDGDANGGGVKEEDVFSVPGEVGTMNSSTFNQQSFELCEPSKTDVHRTTMGIKDVQESLAQTNLTISLSSPSGSIAPYPGVVIEERELGKTIYSFQQVARSRHLLPRPPKSILPTGLETNSGMVSQIRVARPPAEGRVKNQLLPRYWPRITDQELLQISGDSNSTIVPLFEKVLSASDAGRIGRLVLPKACAEAYFPPISQPEGLPLRIQDVKGKEWVFQFRFWPNNNSRMYVLEGVTPCIQSMQLQAGDTVTFSRMDPEGKLLMGFRKASHALALQATHLSVVHNSALSSEPFFSGVTNNLFITSGCSDHLQSLKGSTEPHQGSLQKHMNSSGGDFSWNIMEKQGTDIRDGFLPPSERKRSRNIGSKNKRLLMDSQDALELKLTWEEVQDMLRPPVSEKPSIVSIEEHDFEEYEEPPEFAKRSIFTARSSGGQEQWTQCDSCSKWRRIPVDVLLPSKWTCMDNMWDKSRCSCSVPDELNPRELEVLTQLNKDFKKQKMAMNQRLAQERESTDPTTAAATSAGGGHGDNTSGDQGTPPVATTTRHPRHRPGCSCIVCIQPPSGKGKHKPTCTCNVCMTVKRRFKTLMMRKKKRQSEREAEIAQRNQSQYMWGTNKDEVEEVDSTTGPVNPPKDTSVNDDLQLGCPSNDLPHKLTETGKASLDLNCDPGRDEHFQQGSTHVSMMSLLQVASFPLENYLKQNGLTSLVSEQQGSSGSHSLPQATEQSDGPVHEEQESRIDELGQS